MTPTPAQWSQLDPFPWYRSMRQSQPVSYDPHRYSWGVFRYDDVQCVLSDHTTFSSQFHHGAPSISASP